MNFAVYSHRKLTDVLPVPEGLRELMADITREVLRFQPRNIEAFIADYLESMVLTRELYMIASRTVEDIVDSSCEIVELLKKSGISEDKAGEAVEVLKEEFRNHFEVFDDSEPLRELDIVKRLIQECKLTVDEAQKASEIIESAWHHFYSKNKFQVLKLTPDFGRSIPAQNAINFHQKSPKFTNNLEKSSHNLEKSLNNLEKSSKILDPAFKGFFKRKFHTEVAMGLICEGNSGANWQTPNFQIREKTVLQIQSWYRAAKVRKEFQKKKKAATKIQANFKGYRARKQFKSVQSSSRYSKTSSNQTSSDIPEDELKENAAKKIQANFRGHLARKDLEQKQKAATMIQAQFRGFLTRKTRKEMNY